MRKYLFFTSLIIVFTLFITSCSTIHPNANTNQFTQRINKKLPRYAQLRNKPWPTISEKLLLKPGENSDVIPTIKQRLVWLGDYSRSKNLNNDHYGKDLQRAVERFQWRHGLKTDGIIDSDTIRQLNITPAQRLKQLQKNMERWAEFPTDIGDHYIHINIPSFALDVIENNKKVLNMKVVVGSQYHKTPLVYSKIQTLQFNPHWNVPTSIMRRNIIPKIIKNPNYLAENNIELYDSFRADAKRVSAKGLDWKKLRYSNIPFRMRQLPGEDNALGRVKFIFLNKHDIYLHDTPDKELFQKMQRAYSSGCIRIEKPFTLVRYFIKNNPEIDKKKINEAISTKETQYVRVQNPLPIYVTYFTAWVDKRGVTHFREDVYKRD